MTVSKSIYVASSWRNKMQEPVVYILRAAGFEVYDFKNPPESTGFHWGEVSPGYVSGSEAMLPNDYLNAIRHPRSKEGFKSDMNALESCDICILVLPCGRSAHLELGWAVGAGKETFILLENRDTLMVPELMYKMVDGIALNVMDLLAMLGVED